MGTPLGQDCLQLSVDVQFCNALYLPMNIQDISSKTKSHLLTFEANKDQFEEIGEKIDIHHSF